jgi:hypothetical protein
VKGSVGALVLLLIGTAAFAQPDTEPPVLVDFDFNPKTVDVTDGPADITCTMTVIDSPAGVAEARCQFDSPVAGQWEACSASTPSAGTANDGTFVCVATIEQYAAEGTWLPRVYLNDSVDNWLWYSNSYLRDQGFPADLGVGYVSGTPRVVISTPKDGRRIRGNSVTVRARLAQGSPDDVSPTLGVRFEYRPLPIGSFTPIPARHANHPNPDTTFPYFIHWDVSAVPDGDYELRALAHDLDGVPDPAPEVITITIDHAGPADVDENVTAEGVQENRTVLDDPAENPIGSGDQTEASTATEVIVPAGALTSPTDTAILSYPDPATEEPNLEQPEQSIDAFVDLALESGQTDFEGGLTSDLNVSYSDHDQDGVVDGTSIREDELELRYYDSGSGQYIRMPGWIIMTEHNMVHADTPFTGRFALTGPLLPQIHFETDKLTLAWAAVSEAISYNVYRGILADVADTDADGLPDLGYGDCQNHRDADTTDTTFVADEVPTAEQIGFLYIVNFVGPSGETTLGNTSAGLRREVVVACP